MGDNVHLSREDLLLLQDGELSVAETAAAELHLSECEICRALKLRTEQTFAAAVATIAIETSKMPDDLRDTLHHRIVLARRRPWTIGFASAAAGLLVAAGLGISLHRNHQTIVLYLEDRPVPNPQLTPGAVRIMALGEVCGERDDDLDPAVPAATQQAVFAEYHVPQQQRSKEFQVDYLISPQLGGTAEIRNLWPQPYSTMWNAQAKDMLERRLHGMVCNGTMTLEQAQHDLAGDWIESYKLEFKTQAPLRVEAGLERPLLP
ncbi:anti-sigma factor [Terriglobus sp. 2YAB30_2]|uniref:anti-sigma factor family protein n=1 Tax=unclassified Terriglobus TaxID=2628988 RepID=UPI003F9E9AEF